MNKPQLILSGLLGFNGVVLLNWLASLNPVFQSLRIVLYFAVGAFLFIAWYFDDGVRQWLNVQEYSYDALIAAVAVIFILGVLSVWL